MDHRKLLGVTLLSLLGSSAEGAGWTVVLEDEFDGNELDLNRWATRYIYENERMDHLHTEVQRYRDNNNHIVSDGTLALVARPIEGSDLFESGMIRSRQTFYYGYFEARVRLPRGRGVYPAFWLNPDYDARGKLNWPPEIDIFEYPINGRSDTEFMFHTSASNPFQEPLNYLQHHPRYSLKTRSFTNDRPLNEDWHTFGLVWTPETITVLFDGERVFTREYKWIRDEDRQLGGPAHVLLNFGVGGQWAGRYGIEREAFPQAMLVDHVRVCQMARGNGGSRQCGRSRVTPDPEQFAYDAPFDDVPKPTFRDATLTALPDVEVTALKRGDVAHIVVPFEPAAGKIEARTARVSFIATGGRTPALTASVPLNSETQSPLTFVAPIGQTVKNAVYDVFIEALYEGEGVTRPVPVRCNTAHDQLPKALRCRVTQIPVTTTGSRP
jgi:beta-glucanase (GH16 family)